MCVLFDIFIISCIFFYFTIDLLRLQALFFDFLLFIINIFEMLQYCYHFYINSSKKDSSTQCTHAI